MPKSPFDVTRLDIYDQVEYGIMQPMIAWLVDDRPLRVLDAGCGEGGPALLFAMLGCTVSGIDVDAETLDAANATLKHSGFAAQVEFQQAGMLNLPFADATFDLVYMASYDRQPGFFVGDAEATAYKTDLETAISQPFNGGTMLELGCGTCIFFQFSSVSLIVLMRLIMPHLSTQPSLTYDHLPLCSSHQRTSYPFLHRIRRMFLAGSYYVVG
jgi:hypothetical protein